MNGPEPSAVVALERRLERSANSPRSAFLMNRDEAAALLEVFKQLRANQAHMFERYQPIEVAQSLGFNLGGITLRTRITVNGRKLSMYAQADVLAWDAHGSEFQEYLKKELRRQHIERILADLELPVSAERDFYWSGMPAAALNPFTTQPARP